MLPVLAKLSSEWGVRELKRDSSLSWAIVLCIARCSGDARKTPKPAGDNQKCLQALPRVPGGGGEVRRVEDYSSRCTEVAKSVWISRKWTCYSFDCEMTSDKS